MKWIEDNGLTEHYEGLAFLSEMASHVRVLDIAVIAQTCFIRVLSAVKSCGRVEYG